MPYGTKVFSITDFKQGLDVRKTFLTAPGGSLRLIENAVINQGGEIEKRLAFVQVAALPPEVLYVLGQGNALHVFAVDNVYALDAIDPGSCPVPIVPHALVYGGADPITRIIDVEPFDGRFYVVASTVSGDSVIFWDDAVVSGVHANFAKTYRTKMYRTDGTNLKFSGVGNPTVEDPTDLTHPGAGFINIGINDPEGEAPIAMEAYYDKMAIMARLVTQLWSLDPDPDKDTLMQVLRIGTVAPHSVLQFGTGDVLFLADSGVRSLKALSVNLAAAVSDVGSAIDPLLTARIRTDPDGHSRARAVVQPIAGRYWLAMRETIYVLSFFPAGEITAWSIFYPGFEVKDLTVSVNMIFATDTSNKLYLYGGPSQAEYDACPVQVRTPHHDIETPTTRKRISAVDIMCEGPWSIYLGMLPNSSDPFPFELVASVTGNTFGLQTIPYAGYGTHIGAHLAHGSPGPAKLAGLHFHVQEGSIK
jgi:hypothetical protein